MVNYLGDNVPRDLVKSTFRSGYALILARLVDRVLQLIRMLTIARWLGPQEMGVYSVVLLVIGTLECFSETGLRPALIQRSGNIKPYLLPVRSVQVVRGLLLGLVVFLSAPLVAYFFNSPESLNIIRVMALLPVINGFEPLFFVLAQKELRFKPVVAIQITAAFFSLIVGVTVAYIKPTAWALVFASLTGALIKTTGAHLLSKGRYLGFTLKWLPLKDIRKFGVWMLMTSISVYIFTKSGDWMIGRLLDVYALALYQLTYMICTTITQEIGGVVSELSFPVFSKLQNDKQQLQIVFRKSFGLISIVSLGLAGLVIVCGPDFYSLVLGEKWLSALPLIPWLTVWGVCYLLSSLLGRLFQSVNKPMIWTYTIICMLLILGIGIYPATKWKGALGVAILMSMIGVSMQLIRYIIVSKLLDLKFIKVVKHILFPVISCTIVIIIVNFIRSLFMFSNHLYGIIFSGILVLIFYITMLLMGHQFIEPTPRELKNIILKSIIGR